MRVRETGLKHGLPWTMPFRLRSALTQRVMITSSVRVHARLSIQSRMPERLYRIVLAEIR